MSILFVGDLHLSDVAPASRSTNYPSEVMEKLSQVFRIAVDRHADFVVFTGDIFHRRTFQDFGLLSQVIDMFLKWQEYGKFICYTIIGNHDLSLRTLQLGGQPLELLFSANAICKLPEKLTLFGDVYVCGRGYKREQPPEYFALGDVPTEVDGWPTVMVTHANIIPTGHSTFGIFLNYEQLPRKVDLLVNGHIHAGFAEVQVGKTKFVGLGSVARVSRSDQRDSIGVYFVDFTNGEIDGERINLSVEPYDKVFSEVVETVDGGGHRIDVDKIVAKIETINFESPWEHMDLPPAVQEVVKEYLDKVK